MISNSESFMEPQFEGISDIEKHSSSGSEGSDPFLENPDDLSTSAVLCLNNESEFQERIAEQGFNPVYSSDEESSEEEQLVILNGSDTTKSGEKLAPMISNYGDFRIRDYQWDLYKKAKD
jgi:hypothetical protein